MVVVMEFRSAKFPREQVTLKKQLVHATTKEY